MAKGIYGVMNVDRVDKGCVDGEMRNDLTYDTMMKTNDMTDS